MEILRAAMYPAWPHMPVMASSPPPAHDPGHRHDELGGASGASHLHRLGVGLSVVCALHCLAMPLFVGVLPTLGLSFLAGESTETWLIGATVLLSVIGALWGFRRHRKRLALGTIVSAATLVVLGRWLGERHPLGLPLTVLGAFAIAAGHLWSARLCRCCPAPH